MEGEEQSRKKSKLASGSVQPTLLGYFSRQRKRTDKGNPESESSNKEDGSRPILISDEAEENAVVIEEDSQSSCSSTTEENLTPTTNK